MKAADQPTVAIEQVVAMTVAEIGAAPGPQLDLHAPSLPGISRMIKDVIMREIDGGAGAG
jgi:hypothetical protein